MDEGHIFITFTLIDQIVIFISMFDEVIFWFCDKFSQLTFRARFSEGRALGPWAIWAHPV